MKGGSFCSIRVEFAQVYDYICNEYPVVTSNANKKVRRRPPVRSGHLESDLHYKKAPKKGDTKMKKNILILLCLGILLVLPNLILADCVDLGGFNAFVLSRGNTVVLYAGSTPTGQFDVQNCDVQSQSRILLLNSMVCDGNEVMIDGNRCTVMSVKSLN